ncbi:MAG: tetratricopeptide repeat protein [Chitinispirillaceae bacterium]|jgi:tetratricopeptide (TPR) repeat protein|nr:tetratricopeptide repeat protein [Chitinispirillaceae bacterium]
MALTSDQRQTIVKVAVNSLFLVLLGVGINWGVQYYRLKQKNQAAAFETGAMAFAKEKIIPVDLEAHRIASARFIDIGQPEKALPHLDRLLRFAPHDRGLRFTYGTACLDAGLYSKALEAFTMLLKSPVDDSLTPKILSRKGITLYYLKRIPESRFWLDSCLSLYPNTAEALCFRGQIGAAESPDSPRARADLERAVVLDSLYVEGWYQLARFRMLRKEYAAARKDLMRALEIDPLHIRSHSRLGMVYYYLGSFELARKSYGTALALNPTDFNTRYNLGELYYSSVNDTAAALRVFRGVLKLNPNHAEANFKVGLICLGNGMVKESIRYLERAAENDPENVRVLFQIAVAYEKLGDKIQALKNYKKINALDPLNRIALQKIKYLENLP